MGLFDMVHLQGIICVIILEAISSDLVQNDCIKICVHVRLGRGNATV